MGRISDAIRRKWNTPHYMDYSLVFIVIFLIGFGLIMVYSTSSYEANLTLGDSAYYFKKQLVASIIGLIIMVVMAFIPYRILSSLSFLGYVISAVMIFLVLTPLGYEANGARRWIRIVGISLQPAEIAKLGMIIFLASLICKLGKSINTRKGFCIVLFSPLPIAIMLWRITSNLSSAIIVFAIAFIMLFVACPDYKRFAIVAAVLAAIAFITVFAIQKMASSGAESLSFRGARILAWLDPEAYASGKGFQTLQALYAIGSGGFIGKGLGASMQKLGFLPEAQNDMIFSIICEELGLFGGIAVIVMFLLLLWRFMVIADNAEDMFGGLLVVGVMAHISIQVILNIAVVTNVIPNTGISLPFISYGGSSVVFLLAEIGIVLNVGRGITYKD